VEASVARAQFAAARVARLATVGARGAPHLVPITFALLDDSTLVFAVDGKPKRTMALARLANIAANPAVSVLVDHYSDDWSQLWWARADGTATVVAADAEPSRRAVALAALRERYPVYVEQPPEGALVVISVARWSGWSACTLSPPSALD
jgi:PPOX class probable F420-dependent enzyme